MQEELDIINSSLLELIEDRFGKDHSAFRLWFDGFKLIDLTDTKAIFKSPSDMRAKILCARYKDLIKEKLKDIIGFEVEVDVLFLKDETTPKEPKIIDSSKIELDYERELENRRRERGNTLLSDEDISVLESQKKDEPHETENKKSTVSLYTFDNFVEGSANKFAKAACMGVAKEPGFNYNPLFIHGNSGLGKTHLLYATIKALKENHPGMKIVFKKCESFVNELVAAIKQGSTEIFKERYRSCDVLLIDDIQFIANKEMCQEEFFHTFSTLYEEDKQIILTSDRPPKEIIPLTERLRSRFESGVIADIKVPEFELRAAITKKKAEALGLNIKDELIYNIAQRLRVNIRQIEGVLKKIHMLCGLSGREITMEVVNEAIFSIDPGNMPNDILIERTLTVVSKRYGISIEDLKSKKRTDSIAKARHIAIYLIKDILEEISLKEIGQIFGGRDHSTVLSSLNKVNSDIRTVNGMSEEISAFIRAIKGPEF